MFIFLCISSYLNTKFMKTAFPLVKDAMNAAIALAKSFLVTFQ